MEFPTQYFSLAVFGFLTLSTDTLSKNDHFERCLNEKSSFQPLDIAISDHSGFLLLLYA